MLKVIRGGLVGNKRVGDCNGFSGGGIRQETYKRKAGGGGGDGGDRCLGGSATR
jgi:hypothetical protein